jgi:protein disulfide-isomerase
MSNAAASASERPARAAVAAARERAAVEGKRVAVVFGASWCPDSRALDAALGHPLVAPIVEPSFVVVPVDVGYRDQNLDLMSDYGMDVWKGIPAVALLEPEGTVVTAQRAGEWRSARELSPVEIATFFNDHRRR